MKLLKILAVILFTATTAMAQGGLPIRNDTPTTLRDLGSNLNVGRNYAVDQYGRILLGPSSPGTGAAIYAEDAAFPAGGNLSMAGGVNARNFSAFNSTAGDAVPFALGDKGVLAAMLMYDSSLAGGSTAIVPEDDAATSGDATVRISNKRLDQLATGETGGNAEYAVPIVDTLSRLYVNPWGAAVTEFIQGCNTAIVTATTGDMLAAEASQRYYVSSWSCTNTGAAATRVILEDDDGTDFANVILAATTGFAAVNFPVPVRAGAANKGMQINVITTSSSTICCFNGFKSAY